MSKKSWYIFAPVLAGVLILLDQITKYLARRDLGEAGYSIIDGVFKLSLVENKGAAWGMFQGGVDILSIISIILIIVLVFFFIKIPEGKRYFLIRLLVTIVFAGAIGNEIDRLFVGYVTDFLYFELIDFPVFNVADCYITVGMILFAILMLFYYKDEDLEFFNFRKKAESADKAQENGEISENSKETGTENNDEGEDSENENT